jgi:hypothetical protein
MHGQPPQRPDPRGRGANYRRLVEPTAGDTRPGDFGGCDPKLVVAAVDAVLAAGWGVTFSRTSDGGALAITIYAGNERYRAYAASDAEVTRSLEAMRAKALDEL